MVFYYFMSINKREKFKFSFSKELIIPLEFTNKGSEIIFNDKKFKFSHSLMYNNFSKRDFTAVKQFLNSNNILTQNKKVLEFEKMVKMVRCKV